MSDGKIKMDQKSISDQRIGHILKITNKNNYELDREKIFNVIKAEPDIYSKVEIEIKVNLIELYV